MYKNCNFLWRGKCLFLPCNEIENKKECKNKFHCIWDKDLCLDWDTVQKKSNKVLPKIQINKKSNKKNLLIKKKSNKIFINYIINILNNLNQKKIIWKKSKNGNNVIYIYIDKKKLYIFKKYNNINAINSIKNNYNSLINFDFVPKIYCFDFDNLIIVEDFFKKKLNKKNLPKDYKKQLLNIKIQLNNNDIYHNDIWIIHFFVKNKKIKLIDWDKMTIKKPMVGYYVRNDF